MHSQRLLLLLLHAPPRPTKLCQAASKPLEGRLMSRPRRKPSHVRYQPCRSQFMMSLAPATTICVIVNIFPSWTGGWGARAYHASHVSTAINVLWPSQQLWQDALLEGWFVPLYCILSRHPRSRFPVPGDLPVHPAHLPLSLIYPAALIDIVVATSATRPGEAHLHYHNH
jgi:hypothetical protein